MSEILAVERRGQVTRHEFGQVVGHHHAARTITWMYFYPYVVLDILSRYAVGWMLAAREGAVLARQLIESACRQQHIVPGQLTVHADRGAPMKSKTLELLLTDLEVERSFSRPHV